MEVDSRFVIPGDLISGTKQPRLPAPCQVSESKLPSGLGRTHAPPVLEHQRVFSKLNKARNCEESLDLVSQFKNRFMVAALKPLQEKHSIEITWNFLATSPGKGPVDGISGAVKSVLWNSVRSRMNIVNNASSFTKPAGTSHVEVAKVKRYEIVEIIKALGIEEVFKEAGQIQGIARVHYVAYKNGKTVHLPLTSDGDSNEWVTMCQQFLLETGV